VRLKIPFLTYSGIGQKVEAFFNEYHPSIEIPIPIEEIIELKIGLNIFPFPRLFKDHALNGFLSRDLSTINVDDYQYEQLNEKYRFTIAHELGHYILHKSFYEKLPLFEEADDYIKWRLSIPREDITWFETHGDWFAEQVLVPTAPLENICREVVDKYKRIFTKMDTIPDDVWSYISNEVATFFDVNPPVVEIRIKREKIPEKILIK
jgi:hypothetical protein